MSAPIPSKERLKRIATCGWLAVHERVTPDEAIYMAQRIAALESQNQQLREALKRFISVATDAMPWSEHLDKAVVQGRAALAATEPK